MAHSDEYIDVKQDLDRLKKLFARLSLKKEQEVMMRRMGKRLPASELREIREMEEAIERTLQKRAVITSLQQRNVFESFKYQFQSSMRSWKNRMAMAEQKSEKGGKTRPA